MKPEDYFLEKIQEYPDYYINKAGEVWSTRISDTPYKLKHSKQSDGYMTVKLSNDKYSKTVKVHRLLATQFIQNPESKEFVNHIDGVKHNNNLQNLEWCTAKENAEHAYKMGLLKPQRGADNNCAKLTQDEVDEIRTLYQMYDVSITKLCEHYNITRGPMERLLNNISYSASKYRFRIRKPNRKGGNNSKAKLQDCEVREIRREHANGATNRQLADKYNVRMLVMYNITSNKTYKEA